MTRISSSQTTKRFRKAFQNLPPRIQGQAKAAFRLWQNDPWHRKLRFKKVHATLPIYSVRIGPAWRGLGALHEGKMIWFWIGSHADYDNLLSRL